MVWHVRSVPLMKLPHLLPAGALLTGAAPLIQAAHPSGTRTAQPGAVRGKPVGSHSGDEGTRSEEGLPIRAKILSRGYGCRDTALFSLGKNGWGQPGSPSENGVDLTRPDGQGF